MGERNEYCISLDNSISLLSALRSQNTVNQLVKLLFALTDEINESLKLRDQGDDAGASEISEYLEESLLPLAKKMSYAELKRYLAKTHMAYVYLQASIKSLDYENDDNVNKEIEEPCYMQLAKFRECYAVVECIRVMLIDIIFQRSLSQGNASSTTISLNNINEIILPLEKEYDDFDFLLNKSTQENINKICSVNINNVADMSRCITLTEMVSIDHLREAVKNFYPDTDKRNAFQNKLLNYLVNNLDKIVNVQMVLNPKTTRMNLYYQTLLHILQCIKDVILQTKWNVGLGGVQVCDVNGKLLNTVPHGMSKVLNLIEQVRSDCKAESADKLKRVMEIFSRLSKQITLSANQPSFLFFSLSARDSYTQQHYDELVQYITKTNISLSRNIL